MRRGEEERVHTKKRKSLRKSARERREMRVATRACTRLPFLLPPSSFQRSLISSNSWGSPSSSSSRVGCYISPLTSFRYYSTESSDTSTSYDTSAPQPQWAVKTDADIAELKKQKNITYESIEAVLSRNPITGPQADTLYSMASEAKVKNMDKLLARYITILFFNKKYDEAVEQVNKWKSSNPMTKEIYFSLIDGFAKITEVNRALQFWDEMNTNKVPGGDQVYGVVMKLFEKQGKKDKVLELYERCKKEGIKASGAIYGAYINATIGYKPAKYRKKK